VYRMAMQRTVFAFSLVLALVAGCRTPPTNAAAPGNTMVEPAYDASGDMIRPEGYRRWIFVGASLGLRYVGEDEPPDDGPGTFHNVYIQPEAYDAFMKDGVFPDKTILAMETYTTGTREPKSELTGGFFEDTFSGLSAAVKDSDRFEEEWGYVTFGDASSAAPFPKARCFDCHAEHAATDNVFTQFYPILKR